jgi:hypothetical protein
MYSLGSIDFDNWLGPPPPLRYNQWVALSKPGANHHSFVGTGRRGEPVTFRSKTYFSSKSNAETAALAYRELTASGGLVVVYNGTNYNTTFNHLYKVLKVQIDSIHTIAAAHVGATTYSPAWVVEASWTIQPAAPTSGAS